MAATVATANDDIRDGVVIRAGAGTCRVAAGPLILLCRLRGRLKRDRQQAQNVVVAGDRVRVRVLRPDAEGADPAGVVEDVLPRRSRLSRRASRRTGGRREQVLMANLDQAVAVQSVAEPAPQGCFVDRLLVAASRYGAAPAICLNKIDLDPVTAAWTRWDYYRSLGVAVVRTSAVTGEGLDDLRALLRDRISIFLGASGVGKSALLNAIQPGLTLRTGEVTGRTGLGRHTTTHTELFPLPDGGFLADSPGLRGFDPWDLAPAELRECFADFTPLAAGCRFRTCLHRDEPDCGVKQAVAAGRLPGWRHEAYLDILRDLEDRRREVQGY
ncbi:MAG TPA: ribosome small subunit-dependent GTPase A [Candidatus Krumholzibacteria bacterium]|nr:ribosome small subunit-dependent GTPase A [Candidatus Krumholzibacteria bacterium]HPD72121.1 ribosome small subunit-dependent GTPase A [Candidatus Krumholzibacteria bacterium]HRY40947.1 ribosome small subunit-dependent GTPase A [Candidatus Krumholzibacteria bacterium]